MTYPGVYIQELENTVRTITGVSTSITAFVGRAWRGPVDEPTMLFSFADYEREFGGLWSDSTMSYAVHQFFQNGGSQALVVRVVAQPPAEQTDADSGTEAGEEGQRGRKGRRARRAEGGGEPEPDPAGPSAALFTLDGGWEFVAATPGSWGKKLRVWIDHETMKPDDPQFFNLAVEDSAEGPHSDLSPPGSALREEYRNVSINEGSPRFIGRVLEQRSRLLRLKAAPKTSRSRPSIEKGMVPAQVTSGALPDMNGSSIDAGAVVDEGNRANKTGMFALDKASIFNLLCIPPFQPGTSNPLQTWTAAANYCQERRAFLIVDAPAEWTATTAVTEITQLRSTIVRDHAAVFFPNVRLPDPQHPDVIADYAPCGVVAGVMSRTDANRGIWKAPAGIDANLRGVLGLSIAGHPDNLTDNEIGQLNPQGINCLRGMPGVGQVVWGARTIDGADVFSGSQWKYLPVRRLALYIEESLFRGTQWVVFEPNDEPLWSQIRLNVGGFLHTLFRQGAFQGATPDQAYFVKCSRETTTQDDINNGIVNIIVGFAPVKPAEFVVIKIQQIAQQLG
jgi:phage tail sheath protein FI